MHSVKGQAQVMHGVKEEDKCCMSKQRHLRTGLLSTSWIEVGRSDKGAHHLSNRGSDHLREGIGAVHCQPGQPSLTPPHHLP